MAAEPSARPEGIPGSELPGPFPVGSYAHRLRDWLRGRARVQLFGEVWGLKVSGAKAYFELRDATGAVPCSMWRTDFDGLSVDRASLVDGVEVVIAGGPDYYPGSHTSSPSFSFLVADVRVAGEGDLLAQLDRRRKALAAEGLLDPQKRLAIPALPRTIGVVTGERGKARDDVLAGLRRRGWAGTLVWGFAPVQDRHAAPKITRALQDLAAGGVDVIVVARGGGSLADLFAFCDETLCRTVALLPVPVIASVGHHTDRTLLDDVAAVSCSTPTHAAQAAVGVDCAEARAALLIAGRRLQVQSRRAVLERARGLARLARAPAEHVARHRRRLHQDLREMRASARRRFAGEPPRLNQNLRELRASVRRRVADERGLARTHVVVLDRKIAAASGAGVRERAATLERLRLAIEAHDPQRTLERGYALVSDVEGEPVTSAERAGQASELDVRFADGSVRVRRDRQDRLF